MALTTPFLFFAWALYSRVPQVAQGILLATIPIILLKSLARGQIRRYHGVGEGQHLGA